MSARAFEPVLVPVGNAGPYTGDGNNTWLLMSASLARGERASLIDAGVGTATHLDRLAEALGSRGTVLEHVLVTHAHLDHASGAPSLAARFGVTRFTKFTAPEHDVAGVDWQHAVDGDIVDASGHPLIVLHTPGHAPDHLCFWHEPSGTVFTGDLVNAASSVAIIHSRGGDLAAYLASLERLLTLTPSRLLPGHGPAIDNPSRVLKATLSHRRMRDAQVAAAVTAGHATVRAITDSIYDGLAPELVPLARENVRAHLEKLRREGRVAREGTADRPATAADDDVRWRPVRT